MTVLAQRRGIMLFASVGVAACARQTQPVDVGGPLVWEEDATSVGPGFGARSECIDGATAVHLDVTNPGPLSTEVTMEAEPGAPAEGDTAALADPTETPILAPGDTFEFTLAAPLGSRTGDSSHVELFSDAVVHWSKTWTATVYVVTTSLSDSDVDGVCLYSACDIEASDRCSNTAGGEQDCDDTDATVYPGAPEIEDGKDNDCDGEIDEGS